MYVISKAVSILDFILFFIFFTPPQNLGGVVFSLQFVCVCVFDSAYEQNSSRTDATILNIIFAKRLRILILMARTLLKLVTWVTVTVTQYPFFVHNSLLTSILYISALVCLIKLKFGMQL